MIREVQPEYPELARRRHFHGMVIVEIHVNRMGLVTDARVVTGHPLLREAALIAVRQWYMSLLSSLVNQWKLVTTAAISFPPQSRQKSNPRHLAADAH